MIITTWAHLFRRRSTVKRAFWIVGIACIFAASLYGSYLLQKERDQAYITTRANNDILKLIDTRIGSESDANMQTVKELRAMVERQRQALDNHEKIIKAGEESVRQNNDILKNQQSIMKEVESILKNNRGILLAHDDVMKKQRSDHDKILEQLNILIQGLLREVPKTKKVFQIESNPRLPVTPLDDFRQPGDGDLRPAGRIGPSSKEDDLQPAPR